MNFESMWMFWFFISQVVECVSLVVSSTRFFFLLTLNLLVPLWTKTVAQLTSTVQKKKKKKKGRKEKEKITIKKIPDLKKNNII